jgi:septal ring factor EnvC (AmiA/AmiB activator)
MVHIFSPPGQRPKFARLAVSTLALAMTLALAGCASAPPPDGIMNQADAAVYDPIDLGNAQDKFQQAQNAIAKRDYDVAAQLADEARASAELARTKARLGAARAQIQNKTSANQQLREQIDQSLADQQQQNQSQASGLPQQQQTGDMPAPPSSALGEPVPQGQGFQTYPQNPNPDQPAPPSSTDQGGHL